MIEQRVKVRFDTGPDQLYTYIWNFGIGPAAEDEGWTPLQVGDRVVVPGNWRNPNESEATVAELGSDWPGGPIAHIVRRVVPDAV